MAKKKAAKTEGGTVPSDKVSLHLRLDGDVHRRLSQAASASGISMNQLIQGMVEGCLEHLIQGEPDYKGKARLLGRRSQAGCVFFGKLGAAASEDDKAAARAGALSPEDAEDDPGVVWFGLDYSKRGLRKY